MPAIYATAPGKIILFGEHAVVYGQPAIAVPVSKVRTKATVFAEPRSPSGKIHLQAPGINLEADLSDVPPDHPLAKTITLLLSRLKIAHPPACTIRVTSDIPVASGLGSGAAVSVALLRAFSSFLGRPLADSEVSELAFEVEKLHHGSPSGIDNAVITFARPIYFERGQPIEFLRVPVPFNLVIADSGIHSPTAVAVGELRRLWQEDPDTYQGLFIAVGEITQAARRAIEAGKPELLGELMNENQSLLRQMSVSSPELERLVEAALAAGADGAKLSGAGRGGNMIALAVSAAPERIAEALTMAGATRTIISQVTV